MIGTESWALVGGALLAAATLPQAWTLLTGGRADDFRWTFAAFNLAGLGLFAWRSAVIGEVAFLAVNVLTCSFWGLVLAVKASQALVRRRDAPADPSLPR